MKFYIAEKFEIDNLNDIDVTLAVSHFHDVVISKEGHSEGQDILLDIKYKGKSLNLNKDELLAACRIAMPVDQKRNMMNASSNFDIINSILTAIREEKIVKIHTPGVNGEIGGYPFIIDGRYQANGYIDETVFSLDEMRKANRASIYLDGIENVENGIMTYTDEVIEKVKIEFGCDLTKYINLDNSHEVVSILINEVINPTFNRSGLSD